MGKLARFGSQCTMAVVLREQGQLLHACNRMSEIEVQTVNHQRCASPVAVTDLNTLMDVCRSMNAHASPGEEYCSVPECAEMAIKGLSFCESCEDERMWRDLQRDLYVTKDEWSDEVTIRACSVDSDIEDAEGANLRENTVLDFLLCERRTQFGCEPKSEHATIDHTEPDFGATGCEPLAALETSATSLKRDLSLDKLEAIKKRSKRIYCRRRDCRASSQ